MNLVVTSVLVSCFAFVFGALPVSDLISEKNWKKPFQILFSAQTINALKGVVAVALVTKVESLGLKVVMTMPWIAAFMVILGHTFISWFTGLKKASTHKDGANAVALGALFVLAPPVAITSWVAFFITQKLGENQNRGTELPVLTSIFVAVLSYLVIYPLGPSVWLGFFMAIFLIFQHRENIRSLISDF